MFTCIFLKIHIMRTKKNIVTVDVVKINQLSFERYHSNRIMRSYITNDEIIKTINFWKELCIRLTYKLLYCDLSHRFFIRLKRSPWIILQCKTEIEELSYSDSNIAIFTAVNMKLFMIWRDNPNLIIISKYGMI